MFLGQLRSSDAGKSQINFDLVSQRKTISLNRIFPTSCAKWGLLTRCSRASINNIDHRIVLVLDYGQIVKSYAVEETRPERKYSPAHLVKVNKARIIGTPKPKYISTSYIERQNLTLRHHCKRLARLTLAFSKKLDSFKAAVALNFCYYNFCRIHKTIRCTSAQAASIVPSIWTVNDLLDMVN